MADGPKNLAASVKQRLMNMARDQHRAFDILLVRFALERLLFRLSLSAHRDNYILKGGMLVTQWLEHNNRETRDMDFLGFGEADAEAIKAIFAEIMTIASDDGLAFDTKALVASAIREEMEYGGIRLRTTAYLERTRIPVTLDIGFGDALAASSDRIDYPSLLGMDRPSIRAYPSAAVKPCIMISGIGRSTADHRKGPRSSGKSEDWPAIGLTSLTLMSKQRIRSAR
jgi:hypothetical protein